MEDSAKWLKMELEAIIRTSKENIVVTDGQGRVLKVSPNILSIYGRQAQDVIGKTVFDLEQEGVFSPSITAKVLREKKELQTIQRTNTGRTVMATGSPVFDEDGQIVRVISFSHDLTEIESLRSDYEQLLAQMERYETEIEELRERDIRTEEWIASSKSMRRVWELIQRVARSDATVVFLGESGVGKTMLARALHKGSDRRQASFIEVNCSAIPESLFESEMFGYEAGSFTGADKKGKPGLIELADKGTLFLDELGELPLAMQAKLLKVIQEKQVTRVGGVKPRSIDFRLIASTNQDLETMVKQGRFRQDLYYRLHVIPIQIPALRERPEDIPLLMHYYLKKFNEKYGTDKWYHSATIEALMQYDWPGNVRELENLIERLIIIADSQIILPSHLPSHIVQEGQGTAEKQPVAHVRESHPLAGHHTLKEALEEVEKEWLLQAARMYRSTYEIARAIGLSQPTTVRRLKKYGINSNLNHNS
ncbi:sigma 54-interacting transcriptional regulator [Brevibacillus humidisoli]|uniref:sigma-54 interaction domain-containing protein n=1 Tax=Brevibacillus humidisoli TaxID=2895522 RepID=UPI001E36E251|nr:sigma 54-interacting transcriptional regulator [Brevibacillus humidisoli]UFJ39898.1 sigma 54-interacting transcriptional regulator [Brevibacillus humidisoli]